MGFGDCFLVTVPTPDGDRRILFDCGVFPGGPGPRGIGEVVDQILLDTRDADGASRIDVVVATHRHADHVSGFAEKAWDRVRVREVWMPWTEDYRDPVARKILEAQSTIAQKLTLAATAAPAVKGLAENSLKNADAMSTLHHGFSGGPMVRYLPAAERASHTFTTGVLPGVTIHVLGPSRDERVIRDMNPPKGHSYLRGVEAAEAMLSGEMQPFRDVWEMDEVRYQALYPQLSITSSDRSSLDSFAELDLLAAAVSLDQAVNGTSLMLLLEIGQRHLLFPGDAQWGTWQVALRDPEWRELLGRTDFYKVGHHGSHNATPTDFVTQLFGTLRCAMVSTRANTGSWREIPRLPLLSALTAKTPNVTRSDAGPDTTEFSRHPQNWYVDYELA